MTPLSLTSASTLIPLFAEGKAPNGDNFASLINAPINIADNAALLKGLLFQSADYVVCAEQNPPPLLRALYPNYCEHISEALEKASSTEPQTIYVIAPTSGVHTESIEVAQGGKIHIIVSVNTQWEGEEGAFILNCNNANLALSLYGNLNGNSNAKGIQVTSGEMHYEGTLNNPLCAENGGALSVLEDASLLFKGTLNLAPQKEGCPVSVANGGSCSMVIPLKEADEESFANVDVGGVLYLTNTLRIYTKAPSGIVSGGGTITVNYGTQKT